VPDLGGRRFEFLLPFLSIHSPCVEDFGKSKRCVGFFAERVRKHDYWEVLMNLSFLFVLLLWGCNAPHILRQKSKGMLIEVSAGVFKLKYVNGQNISTVR
jgi:hypothetical protein